MADVREVAPKTPATGFDTAVTMTRGREVARIGVGGEAVQSPFAPANTGREVAPRAYFATLPYAPRLEVDRSKNCIGNDNTCKAFKTKESDHCVGHLKKLAAAEVDH